MSFQCNRRGRGDWRWWCDGTREEKFDRAKTKKNFFIQKFTKFSHSGASESRTRISNQIILIPAHFVYRQIIHEMTWSQQVPIEAENFEVFFWHFSLSTSSGESALKFKHHVSTMFLSSITPLEVACHESQETFSFFFISNFTRRQKKSSLHPKIVIKHAKALPYLSQDWSFPWLIIAFFSLSKKLLSRKKWKFLLLPKSRMLYSI